jgi:ketosteroid isomerase-like protein
MKRTLLFLSLLVAGSLHVVAQAPITISTNNDKLEQEVRQAIKDFDDASSHGDVVKIEALVAYDYFHTDVKGKVQNKVDWMENAFKTYAARVKSGELKWEAYSSDAIKLRVYGGDVAVATGRITLKHQRDTRARQGRFTQVWVRRQGRWQRAVYQLTWIAQEESR